MLQNEKKHLRLHQVKALAIVNSLTNEIIELFQLDDKQRAKKALCRYRKNRILDSVTRKDILSRDDYKCRLCGYAKDLIVHHITPKVMGGKSELENLLTVCNYCHKFLHYNPMFRHETRNNLSELTKLGMKNAVANGKQIGRPKRGIVKPIQP